MKFITLVDGSIGSLEELYLTTEDRKSFLIDTKDCDEEKEFKFLIKKIDEFSQSGSHIMLARFSGRESIIKNIGDECSEMIVPISFNKKSKYFVEHPIDVFAKLVNIFKQGD